MAQPRVRERSRRDLSALDDKRPDGHRIYRYVHKDADPQVRVLKAFAESNQLVDPFKASLGVSGNVGQFPILDPPYNLSALIRLPIQNNMLRQCIAAMVINVEGHGWRLEYVGPEGQETSGPAKAEKIALESLFQCPNPDQTFQEFRDRLRNDLETTGNAYIEVGRDALGRVVMFAHVPSHLMRLTEKDRKTIETEVTLPRDGQLQKVKIQKHFRRFVQIVRERRVYFKEFNDPRTIDQRTGEVVKGGNLRDSATEIIHLSLYSPGSAYGLPRWINQLASLLGSWHAELTNLDFFQENAIPAMALLVSGGQVTQAAVDDMEAHFQAARGRRSMNRVLVIEASGDVTAANRDGTVPAPKLELKPLQNERQKDGLFQEYDANNGTKIRSSFRMPPIFVGLSEDYTHATAKTSYEVAEGQVFGPERNRIDDVINTKILVEYQPQFWKFRSNPPKISDPEETIKALETFERLGGMTPNIVIGLANEMFDLEIPAVEHEWGNWPFEIVKMVASKGQLVGLDEIKEETEELDLTPDPEGDAVQPDAGQEREGGEEPTEEDVVQRVHRIVRRQLLALRKIVDEEPKLHIRKRTRRTAVGASHV